MTVEHGGAFSENMLPDEPLLSQRLERIVDGSTRRRDAPHAGKDIIGSRVRRAAEDTLRHCDELRRRLDAVLPEDHKNIHIAS